MCYMVVEACENGNEQVLKDARRLAGKGEDYVPTSPQEFANHIFCTTYMGTVKLHTGLPK